MAVSAEAVAMLCRLLMGSAAVAWRNCLPTEYAAGLGSSPDRGRKQFSTIWFFDQEEPFFHHLRRVLTVAGRQ
jgi:hypothetical protein